jgi:hypothetical protein
MLPNSAPEDAMSSAIAGIAVIKQIKSRHFQYIVDFLTPWRKCKGNAKLLSR